ncbi:NHL repeat-containing protein [Burkholderia sp. 8Y]|uniref:NHL domain-containing protein n=1 Tax=Burkholderia sp. 8Y TaxID=2653133 RepID=UPI0012F033C6|nr:sugar ABC transporter ATP-binding protein [Burkholderia sp. 8Y]VXC93615.1 NHL repeat-containing protein [Burkholderia sp. 8Y]
MNRPLRTLLLAFMWLVVASVPLAAWPQSQTIVTIAGPGTSGQRGNGGPATAAAIAPERLAVDSRGNILLAEPTFGLVRRIDRKTGIIDVVAGTQAFAAYSGDGRLAKDTSLSAPESVAVSPDDDIYILDNETNGPRIVRVDHRTLIVQTVAGGNARGYAGDGGPVSAAQINATDIAFDRDGNLVISDSGNNRIRRVDRRTGIITTIVGSGIIGAGPPSGPAAAAGFLYYISTAFTRHNDMFFLDVGLSTVRELNRRTATFTTVAGVHPASTGVTFLSGYNGDGQPATQALLNVPTHIAVDCDDNLTISDTFNYRVRQVDHQTGVIETIAGTGSSGYSGDGGLATQAMLSGPRGIAFGHDGSLYIADGGRIRKVEGLPGRHRWDCRDERRYHMHEFQHGDGHHGGDE